LNSHGMFQTVGELHALKRLDFRRLAHQAA